MRKTLTTFEFIKKANNTHSHEYDYSLVEYVNTNSKVVLLCNKHGKFNQTPKLHLQGQGCPVCGKIKKAESKKISFSEFLRRIKLIHGDKYDYKQIIEFNSIKDSFVIICDKHGKFIQNGKTHMEGSGCPKCNSSKGEKIILETLKNLNLYFESQKTFDDCKNKTKLRFDFYVPSKNLLIEFDGEQHYKPFNKFGGIAGFQYLKTLDEIKTKFAKNKNIALLRIPYFKINEINNILRIYG